ncbi:MAG: ABC transporter permease [Bacilli bacterium]
MIMSIEHKKYIKKIKTKNIMIKVTQILLLIIFLTLWQVLSDLNIINTFITSSPLNILKTIINLYQQNNLFIHIFITIKECIIAFFITTILSLLISIILYNFDFLSRVIDPYLTVLGSLPKVALGPILIIWLGANTKSIITMAILISIIVSIQTILNGFENTDKLKIKLLKTFNASKLDILLNVVIPENKNVILNTLKINVSMCLIGVITGEFLTSKAGIGYLIIYGSQVFNLNLVMSGIFILTILSFIMYKLVTSITKE